MRGKNLLLGSTRILALLFVVAAGQIVGACGDDFSKSSEIVDLRVLAIRADPPEIEIPLGESFGLSAVDALVVGGEGPVTYAWTLCVVPGLLQLGVACLDESAIFELGHDPTATVLIPPLDDVLASPELDELFIDLSAGFDISVGLTVTDASGKVVDAVKGLSLTASTDLNVNPTLDGLTWHVEDDEGEPLEVPRGSEPIEVSMTAKIELAAILGDDAVETYQGLQGESQEEMLVSWFADAGEYDQERTSDANPDNGYSPPELDDGEDEREVRMWVVLRDGRGGIDWYQQGLIVRREL